MEWRVETSLSWTKKITINYSREITDRDSRIQHECLERQYEHEWANIESDVRSEGSISNGGEIVGLKLGIECWDRYGEAVVSVDNYGVEGFNPEGRDVDIEDTDEVRASGLAYTCLIGSGLEA